MKTDKNPFGAGRPKLNGKERRVICSDSEYEEVKSLLKSIRQSSKTKKND